MFADLVTSGRIVDLILVLVALETLIVALYRRRQGMTALPSGFAATLLSGACLMLAVRFGLTQAGPYLVAGALAAAGLSHVADLTIRIRQP